MSNNMYRRTRYRPLIPVDCTNSLESLLSVYPPLVTVGMTMHDTLTGPINKNSYPKGDVRDDSLPGAIDRPCYNWLQVLANNFHIKACIAPTKKTVAELETWVNKCHEGCGSSHLFTREGRWFVHLKMVAPPCRTNYHEIGHSQIGSSQIN